MIGFNCKTNESRIQSYKGLFVCLEIFVELGLAHHVKWCLVYLLGQISYSQIFDHEVA